MPCSLLFVCDSPFIADYERGFPFSGEAGRLLDTLIEETSLKKHFTIGYTCAAMCAGLKPDSSWRSPKQSEINNCKDHLHSVVEATKCTHIVRAGKFVQKIEFEGMVVVDINHPNNMILNGLEDSKAYLSARCELSNIPPF